MIHNIILFIDGNKIDDCFLLEGIQVALNANQKSTMSFKIKVCEGDALLKYKGLQADLFYDNSIIFSGTIDYESLDLKNGIRNLKASSRYDAILRDNKDNIGNYIEEMGNKGAGIDDELNFRVNGFCGDIYTNSEDKLIKLNWLDITQNDILNARKIDCYSLDSEFKLEYNDNDTFKHCRLQVLHNRYWQRDVNVIYSNGYGGTNTKGFFDFVNAYSFIPAPPVNRVIETVHNLSWHIENFSYSGLPKAGTYSGKIWNPNPMRCLSYEDAGTTSDGTTLKRCTKTSLFNGEKYYAMYASFKASKRWTQELSILYDISFNNTMPDDGFNIDNYTIDLRDDDISNNWNNTNYCRFEPPSLQLSDGDYYKPLSESEESLINQAFDYVSKARAKKIITANTILYGDIHLPELDFSYNVTDIVSVDSNQLYILWSIIDGIEHNISFNGLSQTTLKIKATYGGSNQNKSILQYIDKDDGVYEPENRTGPISVSFGNKLTLFLSESTPAGVIERVNEICSNKDDNAFYGFSMTQNENGQVSADGFSLKIPEISTDKTNAREINGIYNARFEMLYNIITIKKGGVGC